MGSLAKHPCLRIFSMTSVVNRSFGMAFALRLRLERDSGGG